MVDGVLHLKSLSSGFIIKPNQGLVVDVADGSTKLGYKKGNLVLAIVPDSISRKNTWLNGRTLGVIDLGQFEYEDSQIFEFTVVINKIHGEGKTIPAVGTHHYTQEAYVKLDSNEDAAFICEVLLTIKGSDEFKQQFSPLLINLIKTKESTDVGFHADDKIEV